MSAIAQPSFTGMTAQASMASPKVSIGAIRNSSGLAARRDDGFLHQHLQRVGERLQQAERADHVRSFAQLHRRQHLALGIGQVGDADQQRHQQGQRLEHGQDDDGRRGVCRKAMMCRACGSLLRRQRAGAGERRGALGHGRAGAADRIGLVVVGDRRRRTARR